MKIKNKLFAAASALAITVAASSSVQAGPQYDFAMSLKGQGQINYVNTIMRNYERMLPIYESLLSRYGHYPWAANFQKRYDSMKSEMSLLQTILDKQTEIVTEVGKETVWGPEFEIVKQGIEKLADTRVKQVEEEANGIVKVYEEITRLYERDDTVRKYKSRTIYTIYSNGERVPLVSPKLLKTTTRTHTRTEEERNFVREYAVVVPETPEDDTTEPVESMPILTAEEYRSQDDVLLRGSDTYANAALKRNSRINPDYITRDSGLAPYANSLGYINAPEAWAKGWTGKGSTIAIFDTGIDLDHSEFEGRIAGTKCFTRACEYNTNTIDDGNRYSHGTHVAGIAAAAFDGKGTTGVAPDAQLLIGKTAYDSGFYDLMSVPDAINWAVENGADVMNVSGNYNVDLTYKRSVESIGNGVFRSNDTRSTYATRGYTNLMDWAMLPNLAESMKGNEAVLVMSAGNQRLQFPTFPAHYAIAEDENGELMLGGKAIIAGNWDVRTNRLATSSNAAGTMCLEFDANGECTNDRRISDWYILAPGQWVAAPDKDGEYVVNSGTSMAAPAVSGGIAVIHQMWPHMKGENLVQLLLNTADKTIAGYDENIHGQGLMDLDEATTPQGAIGIPTTGRIDGTSISISSVNGMSIAGASISALDSMMVVDEYDRDFYVNGNNYNVGGTGIANFNDMAEVIVPTTESINVSLADDAFGISTQHDGFTLGMISETETFLGNYANNQLIDVDGADTVYAGYDVTATYGATTLFGGAQMGLTSIDVNSNAMMKSASTLVSNSAKAGMQHNIGASTFGLTAELPLAIVQGTGQFEVANSVSVSGDIENVSMDSSLANTAREFKVGVSHSYAFTNKATLDTYANFTDNAGSIKGHSNYEVGIKFGVTF